MLLSLLMATALRLLLETSSIWSTRDFTTICHSSEQKTFMCCKTGDPEGPAAGYIDPETEEYRAIPMEILVKGDDEPIYGFYARRNRSVYG